MDELKLYQICALEDFDDGYGYIYNYCLFAKSEEDAKEDFNCLAAKRLDCKTKIDSIKEVKPRAGVLLTGQMELWD